MLSSKCYEPVLTAGGDALIDVCGSEWTVVQWSAVIIPFKTPQWYRFTLHV